MRFACRETINISDFKNQFNKNDKITLVKKLKRNTFKYCINGIMKVRLYETDILIYNHQNNSIILDNGGFDTNITKDRLNDLLTNMFFNYTDSDKIRKSKYTPNIFSEKNKWFYQDVSGKIYRYFNGIEINRVSSKPINIDKKAPNFKLIDKKNKIINKLIKDYCKAINDIDVLPDDTSGDCIDCSMGLNNNDITGKHHLFLHLKEIYIMKSLIIKALIGNCGKPFLVYEIYKNSKGNRDLIVRHVRTYLKTRLIKAV